MIEIIILCFVAISILLMVPVTIIHLKKDNVVCLNTQLKKRMIEIMDDGLLKGKTEEEQIKFIKREIRHILNDALDKRII